MKKRKIIISIIATIMLLSSFSVTVAIRNISDGSTICNNKKPDHITNPTIDFYVDDDGGADFEKIQDAINHSNDGYTKIV